MPKPPTPLVFTYIDPDGIKWDLSDRSMKNGYVCSAIAGIEGFPMMMQTYPLLDGTAIPNVYLPQPGTISLAIIVARPELHDHNSENDYYALLDSIVRAFMNRRNEQPKPGTFIVTRPDGTSRQIQTYTISGLDSPDVGLDDKSVYSFSLSTPDPYWQDAQPNVLTYTAGGGATGILPLLPVFLGSSSHLGDIITVVNKGTGLTYPTWDIWGPGTPTITNNTTGRSWALSASVPAGQHVQAVTKRGSQMVMNVTTGANLWSQLVTSSPRDLWPLVGGNNSVTINVNGATAQTAVSISWYNRWQRA